MIKIFTDSTSYIPSDMLLEYNITVLPLHIIINDREILENEITNEHFYKMIRKSHHTAQTKSVQVHEIEEAFEKELQESHPIMAIFLSSKVSQTYNNACSAKENLMEKYPRASITIIDSESVAMEEGLAVLSAAEAIENGEWLEGAQKAAEETIRHTKFLFIPKTLKYLQLGGRLGKSQALLGGALNITPILHSFNGEVGLLETIRTKSRALKRIIEIFKEDVKSYGVTNVIVHHIDAFEDASKFADEVISIANIPVSICDIGPVVGANVGPGAIGIVYKTLQQST